MITQHYKVKRISKLAMPGQRVFESNASNNLVGFISAVDEDYVSVMLFEPMDINIEFINISEKADNWLDVLGEIFNSDADIKKMWMGVMLGKIL
jgi:hypothetical protein